MLLIMVVNLVNNGDSSIGNYFQTLLDNVILMLRLPGRHTSVIHIFREANRCVDFMVNLGYNVLFNGLLWTLLFLC